MYMMTGDGLVSGVRDLYMMIGDILVSGVRDLCT